MVLIGWRSLTSKCFVGWVSVTYNCLMTYSLVELKAQGLEAKLIYDVLRISADSLVTSTIGALEV